MGENIDDLKGKAKEEAGRATDNRDLEAEGKTDQAKADVKRGVDRHHVLGHRRSGTTPCMRPPARPGGVIPVHPPKEARCRPSPTT
jgi:hypothetical protein